MARKSLPHWIALALLVGIALATVGAFVDWERLSIDGFDGSLNDQVGYVAVARDFAEHGTLNSNLVYPVLLRQSVRRTSLYMPGFYWTLAAAYKCFGYSAITSRLPSLIGFLLSVALTYYIGRKLYSSRAAALGCTLFAAFPLCIVYAFTAMMELPLIAAGLAAFAIFLSVAERDRFWLAPLALVIPVLFRETGAIVGVVILAVMVRESSESPYRRVLITALLMAVVMAAILASPVAAGRPSLWKANLLVGGNSEQVYGDAFATDNVSSRPANWVSAIRVTFAKNARSLLRPEGESTVFEQSVVWFILSGIPLGLGLWLRRNDFFALGVGVAVAVLMAAVLGLYTVWGYRGMRVLLLLLPFVAILWGAVLERVLRAGWARAACSIVLFALGTWGAVHLLRSQTEIDTEAKANTAFVESVVGGNRGLLASPFWLSLDYINEHYPQKWSFVPSNCETARLLDERYRIGTVIVPVTHLDGQRERPAPEYCGTGLRLWGKRNYNGTEFAIYRRR